MALENRYTTEEMDELISLSKPFEPFFLNRFFPGVKTFTEASVIIEMEEKGRPLAPFVSPMTQGKPRMRDGHSAKSIVPAYIKPVELVTPQDGFTRRPGEKIGGSLTPMQRIDLLVQRKLENMQEQMDMTMEWMASQILTTGTVVIQGDDYPNPLNVNFGRDPALTVQLVGGARWNQATSTPFDNIEDLSILINERSYGAAKIDELVMKSQTWKYLREHASMANLIDLQKANSNTQMEEGPNNTNQATLVATIAGRFKVWTYDDWYTDNDGNAVSFMPDDTVLLLSQFGIDGVKYYGAIQDLDANVEARERFFKARDLFNPSAVEIVGQSAPMLAPKRPNTWGILKVV